MRFIQFQDEGFQRTHKSSPLDKRAWQARDPQSQHERDEGRDQQCCEAHTTHTCQVTVEISLIDISNPQLPGNTDWDPERNWSNHPPVTSTNVHQLMENIDKLQSNKQYAVIPSDGIESLIAGTHCPQSVWELHQSLKACNSERSYLDDDIAAMHHLHSKSCIIIDASIYSPGTVHKMSEYVASSAHS